MVARGLGENPSAVDNAPSLGVLGAERQLADTCKGDRRRAHCAGLERNPELAIVETRGTEAGCRMPDCDHFGMGGGVELPAHGVARLGDDLSATRDNCADGDFARLRGNGGKVERAAHRLGQRKGHGRPSASRFSRTCHAREARQ